MQHYHSSKEAPNSAKHGKDFSKNNIYFVTKAKFISSANMARHKLILLSVNTSFEPYCSISIHGLLAITFQFFPAKYYHLLVTSCHLKREKIF